MELYKKIEGVLFWKNEPISRKKLADIFTVEKEELDNAIIELKNNLANRGIILIENNDEVMLGTAGELSELIEKLQKEELNKDLSKASLETLSIILYKNGASRSEIDYVRGVNSSFTLRAMSVRGLIEKTPDPKDSRKILYKPTFELLSFMGLKSINELPEYGDLNTKISDLAENLEKEGEHA